MDERTAHGIRTLIAERTGVDLMHLTPAEEKVVEAITEYIAMLQAQGKPAAPRALMQVRNRGLIGAAEAAVAKSKPTQGYRALADTGLANLSYEQIILDHQDEFSPRAIWFARRTLDLPNESGKAPSTGSRNPAWSREELILALDLYLRFRKAPPAKNSGEITELSMLLGRMQHAAGLTNTDRYRNTNGVYMKIMNFRRLDPEYTANGRVGLTRGNKEEAVVWNEFSGDKDKLAHAVAEIRSRVDALAPIEPYWVFVCAPKRWAIDRFLDRRIEHDTWGVRPSDRHLFAPGQLGIVRVGVDRRTVTERNGNPPLEPGIYALCEVESTAFGGTGEKDEFWGEAEPRERGWPTVKIRYLRTYLDRPLTIERLRIESPDLSPLLLNGFQAASFPIAADDFRTVAALLGEDMETLPLTEPSITSDKLAAMEQKYLKANPEVKERLSRTIERGPIGALVKKARGYKCQICEALGVVPFGFLKKNGEPYVEAHHVMPVSKGQIGSLSASNIMVLCANHHRQMHYGGIEVRIGEEAFEFVIAGVAVKIPRSAIAASTAAAQTSLLPAASSPDT